MDLDQIVRLVVLFIALIFFMRKPKPKRGEEAPVKKRAREEALKPELPLKITPAKTLQIQAKKESKQSKFEEYQFQSSIEKRTFETSLDKRYSDPYGKRLDTLNLSSQADAPKYNVIGQKGNSKGSNFISNLRSKKEMVILQEIISLPKALRKD